MGALDRVRAGIAGGVKMDDGAYLQELGQQLRVDSVRAAAATNSGQPTSSMSAADLMAVLIARHLRYDVAAPEDPCNDHLIFSKRHASPLLYSLLKAIGAIWTKSSSVLLEAALHRMNVARLVSRTARRTGCAMSG